MARFPAQMASRLFDGGYARLDVLVASAKIFRGRNCDYLSLRRLFRVVGIFLEGSQDKHGEVGDADVVCRVAEIEDAARGSALAIFDDPQERVDTVVDVGEGAALAAAVHQLDRF